MPRKRSPRARRRRLHDPARRVGEGRAGVPGPKGQLFFSYSGSACGSDDYAIGLLSAPADANPLDPKVWTKAPQPVIAKLPANGVFAPGHNGFFTAPRGEHWIFYHASPEPDVKRTPRRAPRIRRGTFGRDERPIFGDPLGSDALR